MILHMRTSGGGSTVTIPPPRGGDHTRSQLLVVAFYPPEPHGAIVHVYAAVRRQAASDTGMSGP